MSRSGYYECDDGETWAYIRSCGAQASAIKGKRGQKLLRDLLAALDAMPEKRLIAEELVTEDGEVCALGALGKARGLDMSGLDPEDWGQVAKAFGVSETLVRLIEYENDEVGGLPAPERRWQLMRDWVARQIRPVDSAAASGQV